MVSLSICGSSASGAYGSGGSVNDIADEAVGPALARCRAAGGAPVPLSTQPPYFARAEAWAVLAAGDPPRAQQLFLEAAGRLRERPIYAARLTYEALRAGTPARRVARDLEPLAR